MIQRQVLLLSLVFFIFIPQFVCSQVFDGKLDSKLFLGYAAVGESPAIELRLEDGLSDYVSFGWCFMYLITNAGPTTEKYTSVDRFIEKAEAGITLNGHFLKTMNTRYNTDFYAGGYLSLKSLGLQTGVKYNFGERIGIYGQAMKSLSNSFFSDDTDIPNRFGKRLVLSFGLTYNFI